MNERARRRLGAIAVVAGLAAPALLAQEAGGPKGANVIGRYQPAHGAVLDTASGALYFVDPADASACVTLDLVHVTAFVRPVAKDASGWGAVDLAKLDAAVIPPARERAFAATANPREVLDTKTGAVYALEGAPAGRVADWKGVRVTRTDPLLGTRNARELHVTRRGG